MSISNIHITDQFVMTVPRFMFPEGKCKFYVKTIVIGKVSSSVKMVTLYYHEIFGTIKK